jgi:hypothetical protein
MLLLNAEAPKANPCEFPPAVAVAVAAAGRLSAPRIVPPPCTSSVLAGTGVLMPILAVLPVPTGTPPNR